MLEEKELQEYKDFLKANNRCHYAQSLEWANVKKDWKNEIILVRDEANKIKASVSLLIRKIPYLNKTILYAPRGPIFR